MGIKKTTQYLILSSDEKYFSCCRSAKNVLTQKYLCFIWSTPRRGDNLVAIQELFSFLGIRTKHLVLRLTNFYLIWGSPGTLAEYGVDRQGHLRGKGVSKAVCYC